MSFKPEPGLVIRYDFLWKNEEKVGRLEGIKDRPCVIVLVISPEKPQPRKVVVCPITHSPPQPYETAVEIPYKVARHLHLDHDQMWIKTHEVNQFQWEEDRWPFGVSRAYSDQWVFGMMPKAIGQKIFEQVKENSRKKSLSIVARDKK